MEKNYFLNMSYNLIWYVCLCIWICYYVILENIIVAYLNITWTINTLKGKVYYYHSFLLRQIYSIL